MSIKNKKVEKVLSEQLLRDKSKNQMKDLLKTVKKSGGDIGMKVRKDEKTKEDKMPNSIYMDNPFASSRKIETFEDFCSSARKTFEGAKTDNKEMEGEDPCWDDYEMIGTKEKDGKEVPNCVPKDKSKKDKDKEKTNESIISTFESFLPKHLEDMYFWRDREGISLNDDNWVKGTFDDFLRPMFKNLPNHKDRHPYDVLRSGKFIETKDGKIVGQIDTMRGNMVTLDIIDENNEHQYVDFEIDKLVNKIKDNQLKVNSNTTSKNKKVNFPWGKITVKENE
jgi:hypothetical protein